MWKAIVALVLLVMTGQEVQMTTMREALGGSRIVEIVGEETRTYVGEFQRVNDRRIDVKDDFAKYVAVQIEPVEVPRAAAEAQLRPRFRTFLRNLTIFALTRGSSGAAIVFDVKIVDGYLESAGRAGRCGEVPCRSGCADNKPCDLRCNACPARGRGRE